MMTMARRSAWRIHRKDRSSWLFYLWGVGCMDRGVPSGLASWGRIIASFWAMFAILVAQSTVSKYIVQETAPSQSWKTFLRNHAQLIAAVDLCVGSDPDL